MGLPSWCCEMVHGVECELVIDDAYDAGPNAGRRAEAAPEVAMPERGIESTLPGWISRREEARVGADFYNFDDGLADHGDDELDSSDEENPWLALRMAPLSLESPEPNN